MWKLLIIVIVVIFSFLAGTLFADKQYYKSVTEGFVKISETLTSNLAYDSFALIRFYKKNEESPGEAKEYLKRIILMKYTHEDRFVSVFGQRIGGEDSLYTTNLEIKEFILNHPLNECKSVEEEKLFECNLENILPKE